MAALLATGVLASAPVAAAPTDPTQPSVSATTTVDTADPLLAGPRHGRRAVDQLGDQLAVAAARNDLRPAELRSLLLEDPTAWVDREGAVFYKDRGVDPSADSPRTTATAPLAAPLSETFALHSNPDANLTLLLDFDGAQVSGTGWNASGIASAFHAGWDPAGDGTGFSEAERAKIQQVWAMVAEDYAPFDVDVTTEDVPGRVLRSSSADSEYGTRVLVSDSDNAWAAICGRGCGGVAYNSVFDAVGSFYQPAWVFPAGLGDDAKNVAEAASHEAGHNLGLDHDGAFGLGYYEGHGIWAPIMGVGYQRPVVQWSAGSYPGATNGQDDLAILTGYLGARADEASGSVGTPAALPTEPAVIDTRADVDSYLLGTCGAGSQVQVRPADVAPDLDLRAVLYDDSGIARTVAEPPSGVGDGTTASGLAADLTVPAAGPGWVVTVEGVGQGTPTTGGYDDYGSLGAYTISAPGCDGAVVAGTPGTPTDVAASVGGTASLALTWSPPADVGSGPVTGYVVSRSGSAATETLGADARSHTFTGLEAGTTYQLSVSAVNAVGAGAAVTVSATTNPVPLRAPSVPRDLVGAYDQATGVVEAYWTEPADMGTSPVDSYPVYLDGAYLGELPASSRGVEIAQPGGFADGSYVVGVAARSAAGSSPAAEVTVTVLKAIAPSAPANVRATPGDAVATVRWDPRLTEDPSVTTYTVTASADDEAVTATVDGAQTSAVVRGLTNGTTYVVTVVASNPYGDSPDASASVTPAGVPGRVVRPTAVRGDRRVTLAWTAPAANGAPVTGYTVTASPGGARTTVAAGSTSALVTGLTNGTAYTFTVVATNAVGRSAPSTPSTTVTPAGRPTPVGRPTAKVVGTRVVVTWKAANANGTPITAYRVDISKGKDQVLRGTSLKATFTGLRRGAYSFRVVAVNAVGAAAASARVDVRVR